MCKTDALKHLGLQFEIRTVLQINKYKRERKNVNKGNKYKIRVEKLNVDILNKGDMK